MKKPGVLSKATLFGFLLTVKLKILNGNISNEFKFMNLVSLPPFLALYCLNKNCSNHSNKFSYVDISSLKHFFVSNINVNKLEEIKKSVCGFL